MNKQLQQLRLLQIITLAAFIGMLIFVYLLIHLTKIQIDGINYKAVEYFEAYPVQPCATNQSKN